MGFAAKLITAIRSKKARAAFVQMMIEETVKHEMELEPKRFHRQDVRERRRRIHVVEELFVLLRAAKEESAFATAFAEDAVAAVFNGDMKEAKTLTSMIDPDSDDSRAFSPGSLEHMRPLVEALKAMLTEVEA